MTTQPTPERAASRCIAVWRNACLHVLKGVSVISRDEFRMLETAITSAIREACKEKDAEVKRLREALEIIGTANTQPISADYMSPDCMKTLAREALKGGR